MKALIFNKELHQYRLDGNVIPSVTEICSPTLPNTPKIKAAAIYGTAIHKAIYDLYKTGKCLYMFFEIARRTLDKIKEQFSDDQYSLEFEKIGYFDHKDVQFAGTCDLVVSDKKTNKVCAVVDFKTSDEKEWHPAQLSGYNLIFGDLKSQLFNTYIDDYSSNLVRQNAVDFIKIYRAWKNPPDLTVLPDDENKIKVIADYFERVIAAKKHAEILEHSFEEFKKNLIDKMESKHIKKFIYKNLSFTRTEPTFSLRFNSKKFKEDYPDVYDKYISPTAINASLRIKEINFKEQDNGKDIL
ncbi:MAG: hypothetical protein LBD17_04565 [Endomicrobium sp.]|jgi:hypothetical protein|nr:hypothetical protein [Endomicrobium sp.]